MDYLKAKLQERQAYVRNEKVKGTTLSAKPVAQKKGGGPSKESDGISALQPTLPKYVSVPSVLSLRTTS